MFFWNSINSSVTHAAAAPVSDKGIPKDARGACKNQRIQHLSDRFSTSWEVPVILDVHEILPAMGSDMGLCKVAVWKTAWIPFIAWFTQERSHYWTRSE